jgi:hypothetical protein
MARFWLATFEMPESPADAAAGAAPLLAPGARNLAIEVLCDEAGSEYAVLFSTADDPRRPQRLSCLIGFASPAKAANVWRDRGFPLMDAVITRDDKGTIHVASPHFGEDHPMQYESLLFTMTGIVFEGGQGSPRALRAPYEQALEAPDAAHPDTLVLRRSVTWKPERRAARRLKQRELRLEVASTRSPRLAPFETGDLTPARAWAGTVSLPKRQQGIKGDILWRVNRADIFGPGEFRFEDVEVLGFRVDLGAYGRDFTPELEQLVKPLNFHLNDAPGAGAVWDFRYRAATPILLIELLRYGRMKLKSPSLPLVPQDYQSQHELVVRLLVGRVDDDTAQARDPATYVPAIFVDNPWSKVVGRDVQGFDKRMASFCVPGRRGGYVPVLPDGCIHGERKGERKPRPLGDISLIRLVEETGSPVGPAILELQYSFFDYADWGSFLQMGIDLTLSTLSLAATRWRQMDFTAPEFRDRFALSAVMDSLRRLRSVQVCPVADRGLKKTWITGAFIIDEDFRIALPTGTARLTLHAVEADPRTPSAPSAPPSWNLLCKMLGDGRRADLRLLAGSWYRLFGSMDLTIDDGLEWSRPDMLSLFWP